MKIRQAKKIWNNLNENKSLKYKGCTIYVAVCVIAYNHFLILKSQNLFNSDNPSWRWE